MVIVDYALRKRDRDPTTVAAYASAHQCKHCAVAQVYGERSDGPEGRATIGEERHAAPRAWVFLLRRQHVHLLSMGSSL